MGAHVTGVVGPACILGESPIWDFRIDHLAWVDIDGGRVHRWNWHADEVESREMDGRPGSIGLTEDPDVLLVASEHRIGLLDWPTGRVDWRLLLPIGDPSVRLNDGRVGADGAFWVGSMHVPASSRRFIGSIYRIRPDWSWDLRVTGIGVANSLTGTHAGMLWGDTLRGACWLMDGSDDPTEGGSRPPLIDFEDIGLPGGPDGACTDAEGNIWLACVNGSTLARLTTEGRLLDRVDLPIRRPTCPAFGGPQLDTIFVTSIGGGGRYPRFPDEPDAGRVFLVDARVRGVRENLFIVSDLST